jgi:hypothetical protein
VTASSCDLRDGHALAGGLPTVQTVEVVKRSLSDPASMAGATAEEVLALKPSGWLVRPFPAGRAGFRMVSPGKMPGALGTISYYGGGSPGWRDFRTKPEPWLFVLNSATAHQLLVEILAAWALPAESAGAAASDIPRLADATGGLIRDRLVQVHLDPLDQDELLLLDPAQAMSAVADVRNWWRDENDQAAEPATFVLAVSITEKGRKRLASATRPGHRLGMAVRRG